MYIKRCAGLNKVCKLVLQIGIFQKIAAKLGIDEFFKLLLPDYPFRSIPLINNREKSVLGILLEDIKQFWH